MSKAQEIREVLSQELLTLAEILELNIPGFDGGSLRQAAEDCKDPTRHGAKSWGYRVNALSFPGYQPSNKVKPELARAGDSYIEVDLEIAGRCEKIDEGAQDPLYELNFDLLVWGEDGERRLLSAWHLDRHIGDDNDHMYSDHPIYHFQFGGKRMWEQVEDYGGILLPEPPRVAYPPMDAILAVNFVLANYFGHEWSRLLSESLEYERLVRDAQERCWKPYANALGTAWHPGPFENQSWAPNLIWPQLVDNHQTI